MMDVKIKWRIFSDCKKKKKKKKKSGETVLINNHPFPLLTLFILKMSERLWYQFIFTNLMAPLSAFSVPSQALVFQ